MRLAILSAAPLAKNPWAVRFAESRSGELENVSCAAVVPVRKKTAKPDFQISFSGN